MQEGKATHFFSPLLRVPLFSPRQTPRTNSLSGLWLTSFPLRGRAATEAYKRRLPTETGQEVSSPVYEQVEEDREGLLEVRAPRSRQAVGTARGGSSEEAGVCMWEKEEPEESEGEGDEGALEEEEEEELCGKRPRKKSARAQRPAASVMEREESRPEAPGAERQSRAEGCIDKVSEGQEGDLSEEGLQSPHLPAPFTTYSEGVDLGQDARWVHRATCMAYVPLYAVRVRCAFSLSTLCVVSCIPRAVPVVGLVWECTG